MPLSCWKPSGLAPLLRTQPVPCQTPPQPHACSWQIRALVVFHSLRWPPSHQQTSRGPLCRGQGSPPTPLTCLALQASAAVTPGRRSDSRISRMILARGAVSVGSRPLPHHAQCPWGRDPLRPGCSLLCPGRTRSWPSAPADLCCRASEQLPGGQPRPDTRCSSHCPLGVLGEA